VSTVDVDVHLDTSVNRRSSAINHRGTRGEFSPTCRVHFCVTRSPIVRGAELARAASPGDLKINPFEGEIRFLPSCATRPALIAIPSIANRAQLITDRRRRLSNPPDPFSAIHFANSLSQEPPRGPRGRRWGGGREGIISNSANRISRFRDRSIDGSTFRNVDARQWQMQFLHRPARQRGEKRRGKGKLI